MAIVHIYLLFAKQNVENIKAQKYFILISFVVHISYSFTMVSVDGTWLVLYRICYQRSVNFNSKCYMSVKILIAYKLSNDMP